MNPAEFATLARTEKDLWWFQGMRNILFNIIDSHVSNRAISRVLEAGCGTGLTAKLLHQRYGWMTVAADLSTEGINLAQRSGRIFPVQADIAACPFPGEAFDAVFCLDVLVHFPRGEEMHAIAEFARTLRPGGALILRTSALDWLRSRHSEFTHERQRFTRERLIRAVEKQGFRVVRCTYANSLLLPIAAARFRIWEPLVNAPPASGTAPISGWLNALMSTPLAVEAMLLRWFDLPLGQTLVLVAEKPQS
jgi:SAM-dependent methyltransferase